MDRDQRDRTGSKLRPETQYCHIISIVLHYGETQSLKYSFIHQEHAQSRTHVSNDVNGKSHRSVLEQSAG